MTDLRTKLQNIEMIVEDIRLFPQTYKSILGDDVNDGTCQFMLRKKLNKLCKEGVVCKTSIPGTRFGKAIFYVLPKKYNILIEAGRAGSNVYCFFDYEKISRYYIKVIKCWMLKKGKWIKENGDKIFFDGNVLKWI